MGGDTAPGEIVDCRASWRRGSNGDRGLEKHPERTFIERIERGFDFLGYHFSPKGLTAAKETLKPFVSRTTRLYEQSGKFSRFLPAWVIRQTFASVAVGGSNTDSHSR